jgi:hypothetical protein
LLLIILLVSVVGVEIFNILNSILKFFGKRYSLALHLVENNKDLDPAPDPDRQALDADPDPDFAGPGCRTLSGSAKMMPIRADPAPQHPG